MGKANRNQGSKANSTETHKVCASHVVKITRRNRPTISLNMWGRDVHAVEETDAGRRNAFRHVREQSATTAREKEQNPPREIHVN